MCVYTCICMKNVPCLVISQQKTLDNYILTAPAHTWVLDCWLNRVRIYTVGFEVHKRPLRCIREFSAFRSHCFNLATDSPHNGTDGVRREKAIFVSGREDIFSSVEINKGQVLRDQHVGKRNSPAPSSSALRFLLSFPRRPPCKAWFPSTSLCIVPAAQPPWKDAWNSEPTVSRIHEAGLAGVNPPIHSVAVQVRDEMEGENTGKFQRALPSEKRAIIKRECQRGENILTG